jgi:hypothetical protein
MSLETWKKEFYPVTAKQAARSTILQSLLHSLRKWRGLTQRNLKRHGLRLVGHTIIDGEHNNLKRFHINAETCGLCHKFYEGFGHTRCSRCPLAILRRGHACDYNCRSPYHVFIWCSNPLPMIRLLEKAVKLYQRKARKRKN